MQTRNFPPQWRGFSGYMKRAGYRYISFTAELSVEHPISAVLKHDPRYVPCKCKNVFARFGHAVLFNVVTVNHRGRIVPNISRYVGAYSGAALSGAVLPGRYHTWRSLREGNGALYWGWIINVLREFSPEFKGWISLADKPAPKRQ
jgi:hypothetical protein